MRGRRKEEGAVVRLMQFASCLWPVSVQRYEVAARNERAREEYLVKMLDICGDRQAGRGRARGTERPRFG